jgi:aldose 1-epimerase
MIKHRKWGTLDGKDVLLFRIENEHGSYVEITNYGATLVSVVVPDRKGNMGNVVLRYPSLEGYLKDKCYIGSTIGRFANRIGNASFTLDGIVYSLEKNDGQNNNHGGSSGFNSKVFDFLIEGDKLHLTMSSAHGEGGFPGNLKLHVIYSWSDRNELFIEYIAGSDKKTVANFTNHAYFDLGADKGKIFDHELTIHASQILETNDEYIPIGKVVSAGDKQFNHNELREKMSLDGREMKGLNSYYILDENYTGPACILTHPRSGRKLEVLTTYPGVQLYTGDFLNSEVVSDRGSVHEPFDGLCLECQFYPDSPNHDHFPSTVINTDEIYHHHIIYRFSADA